MLRDENARQKIWMENLKILKQKESSIKIPLQLADLDNVGTLLTKIHEEVTSGIYFLCDKRCIVYIGQAKNIYQRPFQHTKKKFNSIFYILVPNRELDRVEAAFIRYFRPKYNRTHKDLSIDILNQEAEIIVKHFMKMP